MLPGYDGQPALCQPRGDFPTPRRRRLAEVVPRRPVLPKRSPEPVVARRERHWRWRI